MGCDIHLYAEVLKDGAWVSPETWVEEYGALDVPYESKLFTDRNYRLFSILADVRNAEEGDDDYLNPILPPRGIPIDSCQNIKASYENDGGHSASYFTVAELMAYDWTQIVMLRGYVSIPIYADWIRWSRANGESPEEWCGETSRRKVTNEEAELIAQQSTKEDLKSKYWNVATAIEWKQPYYKCAGRSFLGELLPKLWKFGKPDEVRIVFWFDN